MMNYSAVHLYMKRLNQSPIFVPLCVFVLFFKGKITLQLENESLYFIETLYKQ